MVAPESLLIGFYGLAAGFGILGWWALEWAAHGKSALLTHGAPHILAELVTTLVLILGGIALLLESPHAQVIVPVAMGMLLYATINALGRVGRESPRLGMVMVVEACITCAIILTLFFGL
jgi:hypothetical protein